MAFQSWRDFKHDDEYDLEQAENRWERRHMERDNKKLKAPLYKKEKARITKLATIAKSKDPRVQQYEKDQREEHEARQREIQANKLIRQ